LQKHFSQKNLIILRSCNELLRRLSRAEDTVFCGRVFIFLFQSFPLGDKSSVNLRGLFHIENLTVYDKDNQKSGDAIEPMDLVSAPDKSTSDEGTPVAAPTAKTDNTTSAKASTPASKPDSPPDLDALYPMFWAMQADFSCPTRLFEADNLVNFKKSLSITLECFQKVHSNISGTINRSDETRRGGKRKRLATESGFSNNFNTKYLTNRDLFDLEVHDIAFRRHILVQGLIILDFLLSLAPRAKEKMAVSMNKAVLYPFTLSEEDGIWASTTKASIASYLQQGNGTEGKFYYRMVDTVLSRDKNWVRWKADSCPSIDRPAIQVEDYLNAQGRLKKLCTQHSLSPPNVTEYDFLSTSISMDSLKNQDKLSIPAPESFYRDIKMEALDAEMGTQEDIEAAKESKASKIWRAIRASRNKFSLCESIENGKNLEALLEGNAATVPATGQDGDAAAGSA
jgi:THO complex subunit 1